MFKPGDFVRYIHDKEEGRIVRHLSNNTWEIETPDGFRIPVLASEIVIVEKDNAEEDDEVLAPTHKLTGKSLALINFNDQHWDLCLVNDSMSTLLYTLYETPKNDSIKGLISGSIAPQQTTTLHRIAWTQLQQDFQGEIQFCCFTKNPEVVPPTVQLAFKFSGVQILRSSQTIPLTDKKGFLYSIDQHTAQTKKQEQVNVIEPRVPQLQIQNALSEVDLHIEKLLPDTTGMSAGDMLKFQLDTFEKQLDLAIANGKSDITFIHGIGNGILKQELHKRLAQNKNISFFSDARKEKFGYGATLVSFK